MDYSLYKYWVVGLSHSLQINTFGEDLIPICLTLVVYLFLPTAIFALPVSKVGLAQFGKAVMAT